MDSLKKREVWIRMGIHFVSVLGIVVLCASLFHWFGQTINLRIICLMYSLIYLFVWCATAWMAKVDEIKINGAIKKSARFGIRNKAFHENKAFHGKSATQ